MDKMLSEDSVAVIASAVTPWKRACPGQRSLKMCESFQSAATGAATVITFARVSRPRPSSLPLPAAPDRVICTSDQLDGPTPTLLPAAFLVLLTNVGLYGHQVIAASARR